MHRFSAAGCGGVGNNTSGGSGARDTTRSDFSYSSSNIPISSRRTVQLTPYKAKCDHEVLNSRLGPPDYYPPTPNCPEETLTREAVQYGYKETTDGIEENKEISLSLFSEQFWNKSLINRYKESIRKRLRAINDARVQKRKAGQVYGVPLSGPLLLKPGLFPEQRASGEDFKRKWIEGLSQPHKSLRSLAEHVPHGYRKKALFEALIKHNVPLLRATWFIKVTYLNQVRPVSTGISTGGTDKAHSKRVELWSKDILEYVSCLFEEACQPDATGATQYNRDQQSPQKHLGGFMLHQCAESSQTTEGEEPALHVKWHYMMQLLYWHFAEGLVHRANVIDWFLLQLQEKESLDALEMLLPVLFEFVDTIILSQSHVRTFVDAIVQWLRLLSPSGNVPVLKDNAREAYNVIFLSEILRYLIIVVPDTFVSLDCFPLPSCVCLLPPDNCLYPLTFYGDSKGLSADLNISKQESADSLVERKISDRDISIANTIVSIQKRASNLAKSVCPGILRNNQGKAVQSLDRALALGDVKSAYHCVFEEVFTGESIPDEWISDISPCIRSSLRFMNTLESAEIYAVFFLCEWATCYFRNHRDALPVGQKVTGKRDISRIYIAVSVMIMKMKELQKTNKSDKESGNNIAHPAVSSDGLVTGREEKRDSNRLFSIIQIFPKEYFDGNAVASEFVRSRGPIHDAIVLWLDRHESRNRVGLKHLEVLLLEFIRSGIFNLHVYLRQLIISGTLDKRESSVDIERANWHKLILRRLPAPFVFQTFEEVKMELDPMFSEAIRVYSNERRFVLESFQKRKGKDREESKVKVNFSVNSVSLCDDVFALKAGKKKIPDISGCLKLGKNKQEKRKLQLINELKHIISNILHFPDSLVVPRGKVTASKALSAHGKYNRSLNTPNAKGEKAEATLGCEECVRNKRQKISEEKGLFVKGLSFGTGEDYDTWWMKKSPKVPEPVKVEQPLKPTKQTIRGRQKPRKTQSLSQLNAARIESSQGASPSHICENKVDCPHHKTALDVEDLHRVKDGNKAQPLGDMHLIYSMIKSLRLVEKWSVGIWLQNVVKQLIQGREKLTSIKPTHPSAPNTSSGLSNASDERSTARWHLTEEEMNIIVYILDISLDLRSTINFLLWLLPKAPFVSLASNGGRSIPMLSWPRDGDACEVGESFILSCLQRYENTILAANLLPEVLSASMNRISTVTSSNSGGRVTCHTVQYVKCLLKKYGELASVVSWEKDFKLTSDQRLVSEIEAYKSSESEPGYGYVGLAGSGSEENDEFLRQKLLTGRHSRIGSSLKETIQRRINDAVCFIISKMNKEREISGLAKNTVVEKDGYQQAQNMVKELINALRQSFQNDFFGLIATVVAQVVGSVGQAIANSIPDFSGNNGYANPSIPTWSSIKCARQVIQIHIYCIKLLKEAIGERQSRILEVALAMEAISNISVVFSSGKTTRSQFPLSPETPDITSGTGSDTQKTSLKGYFGKTQKAAAAVTALVIGSVVNGLASLEKIISLMKIREGLDLSQFLKLNRPNYNGLSRAGATVQSAKSDNSIETCLHWFRVLIGNCKTVFDGVLVDLLGDSCISALFRMQHMLPVNCIFPPTYSVFSLLLWRVHVPWTSVNNLDDNQLHSLLSLSISDAVRHEPVRDVCLRDTKVLYQYLTKDVSDCEFANLLDTQGLDVLSKLRALVPLRGRLFLHALLDCQVSSSTFSQNELSWHCVQGDLKGSAAIGTTLVDELVYLLDNLHPAKFRWQWLELRLLLNEQVLIEKIESNRASAFEAMQTFTLNGDSIHLSEPEKSFTEIVLTRLLVRPDAAALYSEVVHLLGKSLEDYLILHVRWVLDGNDLLVGRKSLRQILETLAHKRCLSTKIQHFSPWARAVSQNDCHPMDLDKKKSEAGSPEEGEVADESFDSNKVSRHSAFAFIDAEKDVCHQKQYFAIEKGLADLVLPCLARSSAETRNSFVSALVKQMNELEQHISMVTRTSGKAISGTSSGSEIAGMKGQGSRKGLKGSSPGLGRRQTLNTEPPSAAALQTSLWMRLQFLLPLLPIIHVDRDISSRNMRHSLAPVLLGLLGTRVVQEAMDPFITHGGKYLLARKDHDCYAEVSAASAAALTGENLFDRILLVLHALMSSTWPSWLKPKATTKPSRDAPAIDREFAEKMQADLDRMQLPSAIRFRLQAAMPLLPPVSVPYISCIPSQVPYPSSANTQSNNASYGAVGTYQKNATRVANAMGKSKASVYQEPEIEIDPWMLLEDGTGSGVGVNSGGSIGGDHVNLKACSWLKGAVRVRRTDLTYIGSVDDDV